MSELLKHLPTNALYFYCSTVMVIGNLRCMFTAMAGRKNIHCLLPVHYLRLQSLLSTTTIDADITLRSSDNVNVICRVLSDHRHPHHDLESALAKLPFVISTDIVEQVLKRCKGLVVSAHRFFFWTEKLPNFAHSTNSYYILVEILGRSRHFPLIWDIFYDRRDRGHEIGKKFFWLLFRAYCRARLPNDAVRAFGKMKDFGIDPDIDDFHQILLNLCGNGLMDSAMDIFRNWNSVDVKSFSILMKGWVDSKNPAEAVKVFDEMMIRSVPDVIAYNTFIGALCKCGELARAHKVFKDMKTHGLEPDASTYAVLVRAYSDVNDLDSADRVLHQMRRLKFVANVFTYNCVIKLLCRNQKVDEAYEILDGMIAEGLNPDIWSYNTILSVHCKLREVNRALRLVRRMLMSRQNENSGCLPNLHTYNMLLKLLFDVGRIDRAIEVWDRMEAEGFYPSSSTYAVMIHGLCKKKGMVEEGVRYFEMMVDEGIPPYLNTCEMLRDCLIKLGSLDNLKVIRHKMKQSSSISTQELSDVMVDNRRRRRYKALYDDNDDQQKQSESIDDQWPHLPNQTVQV